MIVIAYPALEDHDREVAVLVHVRHRGAAAEQGGRQQQVRGRDGGQDEGGRAEGHRPGAPRGRHGQAQPEGQNIASG